MRPIFIFHVLHILKISPGAYKVPIFYEKHSYYFTPNRLALTLMPLKYAGYETLMAYFPRKSFKTTFLSNLVS